MLPEARCGNVIWHHLFLALLFSILLYASLLFLLFNDCSCSDCLPASMFGDKRIGAALYLIGALYVPYSNLSQHSVFCIETAHPISLHVSIIIFSFAFGSLIWVMGACNLHTQWT
jgi:phosphoglycerol transferase MdoB-like AlkP superfamily enzyme